MAKHCRRGMGPQALDEMEVAMADAGGGRAHEHLVLARLVDLDFLDTPRLTGSWKTAAFNSLSCYLLSLSRSLAYSVDIKTVRATSPAFIARKAS